MRFVLNYPVGRLHVNTVCNVIGFNDQVVFNDRLFKYENHMLCLIVKMNFSIYFFFYFLFIGRKFCVDSLI